MARLTLQFHADRIEILTMTRTWARELGLFMVWERFTPMYAAELVDEETALARQKASMSDIDRVASTSDIDRVSLSLHPVDLDVASSLEYLRRNPEILTVALGAQSDRLLRESFMAAMTDDAKSLATWRRVRELARALMNKGAWIVNVGSGARVRKASHYYSAGAKALSENGVRMLGDSDLIEYELD